MNKGKAGVDFQKIVITKETQITNVGLVWMCFLLNSYKVFKKEFEHQLNLHSCHHFPLTIIVSLIISPLL